MKRKTIIALALAVGLLLSGTVAYGHWNGYGDRSYRGTGYGHGYGAGYNRSAHIVRAKAYMPCYSNRHGNWNWAANNNRHGYANTWMGHRGHGRTGLRGFR